MISLEDNNAEKLAELHPTFAQKVLVWFGILLQDEEEFEVWITDASRTQARQLKLWRQGRDPETGAIVDSSKVVTRARPEKAPHCHNGAIDAVPVIAGKWLWERLDLFEKMNVAARSLQIVCGVDFHDNGHFEDPEWRTFPLNS